MVPRDDDRPTLVALVDPIRCVSCGICAGSCAPMGVGPPGRTGRDQLSDVRLVIGADLGHLTSKAAVAVCCAQAPRAQLDALRARGAHLHLVTCVGNLHSSVVEMLLRGGAPGVVVCGCPSRDCVNREGPKWLVERLFNDREAELQERVDRRRVKVMTLAPGAMTEALKQFDAIAAEFAELDLPELDQLEPELECEPVPVPPRKVRR